MIIINNYLRMRDKKKKKTRNKSQYYNLHEIRIVWTNKYCVLRRAGDFSIYCKHNKL